MDMTTYPIYLVGGSKGGVGKSFVALALADYLLRRDIHAALVETDTSNPDVMKAVQDEMRCIAYNLDDADGWIGPRQFLRRANATPRSLLTRRRGARRVSSSSARHWPARLASFGVGLLSCG